MISKTELLFIIIIMLAIMYSVHVTWSSKHKSVLRNPVITIVQIMGIVFLTQAAVLLLVSYLTGLEITFSYALIEGGIFTLLCAGVIYVLLIRPLFSAIRQRMKLSSGIIDNAADAIITIDDKNLILSMNKTAVRIFGYPADNLIGQNIKMIVSDIDDSNEMKLSEFLSKVDQKSDENKLTVFGVHKDGTRIPIELGVSEHVADDQQRLYTLIMHDLTELKRSEEFYKELFNNSPIGIYIVENGVFKFVNPQFQKYTGYTEEELLDRKCSDIVFSEDWEKLRENAVKMLKGEQSAAYEYRVVQKNGETRWILETVVPVTFNSGRAALGNFIYIDEYKRMEKTLSDTNEVLGNRIKELESRNEHIELIIEMSEVLQSSVNVKEACKTIAYFARKLFPGDSGAMCLINETQNLAEVISEWGEGGLSKDVFIIDDCWGLRRGRAHVVREEDAELRCGHFNPQGNFDYLCVPLIAQSTILGVLLLCMDRDGAASVSEEEFENKVRLAKSVAEYASLVLKNLKLQDRLRQRSRTDALTGLYNRWYMEEALEREVAYARRSEEPVGLVMFDVDHFKNFNDTYGHEAGDMVLSTIAKAINKFVRSSDIACRYGGEEFLIILPGMPIDGAISRAEKLREHVKELQLEWGEKSLDTITLSLGVAIYPENGRTPSELLQAADGALYRAKREGRDRTVMAEAEGMKDGEYVSAVRN